MKKTTVLFTVLAAAFCPLSCQKGSVSTESGSKQAAIIHAISEPITGVKSEVVFTYDLLWEADDEICVAQNESDASTVAKCDIFKLVSGADSKEGTFEQQGEVSFEGRVEAYYPSSLIGGIGSEPVWPSVQAVDVKVPLYCTNTLSGTGDEEFRFSSLGAMLQIVFNTSVNNVTLTSIEIKDGEKTMSGTFKVDSGKAVITATDKAGIILNLGEGVALGYGVNYFNIAIPAGNYQNLTLIFNASDGRACTMTGGKVALARNEVGKLSLTGSKFRYFALPGEFSVGWERKVRFSRGNLYYNGSTFTMEDTQYDYPTSWKDTHVGHFGWNKDALTAATSMKAFDVNGEFFTNADEHTPNPDFTVCSLTGMFRILDWEEWNYVINNRDNAEELRRFCVNVCGKANCLVLAPDNWDGTIQDSYDSEQWWQAETEGLVCIPPVGSRDNSTISDAGISGAYWTSTYEKKGVNDGSTVSWWFNGKESTNGFETFVWTGETCGFGHAVRLVTDVK